MAPQNGSLAQTCEGLAWVSPATVREQGLDEPLQA